MSPRTPARSRLAALTLAACLTPALAGCDALGWLSKPSARITGLHFQSIDLSAATMLFDVEVTNPYAVNLPLVNMDYGLASNSTKFLTGATTLQGTSVPARGATTVPIPVKVTYLDALKALADVRLGQVVPFQAELGLSVDAPGVGTLRLPLTEDGQLPIPAPPGVAVEQIKWDTLTLDRTGGTIALNLTNNNQFPIVLSKLAYALSLGDVKVADSSIARDLTLAASGGSGQLQIPISISPRSLGLAAWNMVSGSGSGYRLNGMMEVGSPFGPMNLPLDKIGQTVFKR
ncbi:MAG: hypothetical protein BIFFINMI_02585 [Phycisphaerae bacterium]|nr:hypothetical protein [Phycisphaerae bacterium]